MTARLVGINTGLTHTSAANVVGVAPPPIILSPYAPVNGLLFLLLAGTDGDCGAITPPTDFTAITGITNGVHSTQGTPSLGTFTKVAASEPSGNNYSITYANDEGAVASLLAIDGHNGVNIAARAEGNDAAPIAPTVTTTVDDCLVLQGFVSDLATQPHTQNDGTYTLKDFFSGRSLTSGASICGGTRVQTAAGATGTFTFAMTSDQWISFTIAIAPGPFIGSLRQPQARALIGI